MPAQMIAGILKAEKESRGRCLDIAAGHGVYGVALARKKNSNAKNRCCDWEAGAGKVAKENAAKAGVGDPLHADCGQRF